ncbi:hypothetical protein IWX47DRAFT_8091 [Phyllosticta citricarpa]
MYPVTEQTVAQIAPWPEPPPCLHNSPSRTQSVTKPPSSTSSWILGTGMRRRPESVFSRRGAATPVEEVAPDCTRCVPSEAPRKSSKRKPGRRRFSMEDKSGTILHAVPRAIVEDLSPRAMTAAFINRCIATPSCHSRSNSEGSSMDLPELRSEIYSISEETTALGDGNEKRDSLGTPPDSQHCTNSVHQHHRHQTVRLATGMSFRQTTATVVEHPSPALMTMGNLHCDRNLNFTPTVVQQVKLSLSARRSQPAFSMRTLLLS